MNIATGSSLVVVSSGIYKISGLKILLGTEVFYRPAWFAYLVRPTASAIVTWGRKPTAIVAERIAARHALPLLRLEDGFLRSVGLGHQDAPLSVVLDHVGIYYDASAPSYLEQLISKTLSAQEFSRANALISAWQSARVSKYNHSREHGWQTAKPFVLVVDQTFGDASIAYGLADASSFQHMLQTAIQKYPSHQILIKTHPDVLAGQKQGHFDLQLLECSPQVKILAEDVHPPHLLSQATAVFCVTSQLGFEALLWQKPVFTFGMPFYAGYGLTQDAIDAPARRQPTSLQQLVHAALIDYPRYLDPETGRICQVETLLAWINTQRIRRQALPATLYAVGFPWIKRRFLTRFLKGISLRFVPCPSRVPVAQQWLSWGSSVSGAEQIRVEDGFIRSVGLGAELVSPLSWVFDDMGIYYDSSIPSRLEHILANHAFDTSLLLQAQQLQQALITAKVTKYNVGQKNWRRPIKSLVVLVPGQVESDASIRLGSPAIQTNLGLLQQVRADFPTAYIVYKPHPDVQAGLRAAGQDESAVANYCDEIVTDQDMAHLLTLVDAVHTLTSLTGFEALLRGVAVYCYGQPFYAGWGLTHDWLPIQRRQRQLTLTELVAGSLLIYPSYFHPFSGGFTNALTAVSLLQQQRSKLRERVPWQRWLLLGWRQLQKLWLSNKKL